MAGNRPVGSPFRACPLARPASLARVAGSLNSVTGMLNRAGRAEILQLHLMQSRFRVIILRDRVTISTLSVPE